MGDEVPGELPEEIAQIIAEIDGDIGALEDRIAISLERIEESVLRLERARADVQSALDEHQLERMLAGRDAEGDGDDDLALAALRRQDADLRDRYRASCDLYRQLSGFVHLLTASRQQFGDSNELPDVEDGRRLALREALIQAQEDERKRLAREIHDGPAQVLANAIIGLEFIGRSLQQVSLNGSGERVTTELERVKSAMREGLTEIRRFIFDLKPSMLSQRGLAATVEHYLQTYRHLFPSEVQLDVAESLPRLTSEQELTAFRVIQESLQNVHRHAKSTQTWVTLGVCDDGLAVEVRDDGQGFRPETTGPSASGGFGLVGMRERAEVLGARLTVESEPGVGTRVRLVIPLNRRAMYPVRANALADDPSRGAQRRAKLNLTL